MQTRLAHPQKRRRGWRGKAPASLWWRVDGIPVFHHGCKLRGGAQGRSRHSTARVWTNQKRHALGEEPHACPNRAAVAYTVPWPWPCRRWVESPAPLRQGKPCRPASSIAGVVTREPEVGLCQSTPNHHSHPDREPTSGNHTFSKLPGMKDSPSDVPVYQAATSRALATRFTCAAPGAEPRTIPFRRTHGWCELPEFVRHVLNARQQIKVCNLEAD